MPRTATKSQRVSDREKSSKKKEPDKVKKRPPFDLLLALLSGVLMGLSAPGFDQWYLAWFALAPYFLLSVGSQTYKQALVRGFVYGAAYNLVYLNWYLNLHPLNWLDLNDLQSILLSVLCWVIVSSHQGVLFAIFSVLCRFIPLCGGLLPRKVEDKWKLPALLVLPVLFQLAFEKLLNAHDLLGVPWSMIEYSQYKQTAFIQIASMVGGIGVGAIVVMVNVAVAMLLATASKKFAVKSLACTSKMAAVCSLLATMLIVCGCTIYGFGHLQKSKYEPNHNLSILQGNINIEMQKTRHRYTLAELMGHYSKLLKRCSPGFCIWTESAMPTYLRDSPLTLSFLRSQALEHRLDMVVGSIDSDDGNRPFNSAFGITRDGKLLPEAYHKRFLVPVGEYTPAFVKFLPDFIQNLTNTPAGMGFSPGSKPVVLDFAGKRVAPLICFETIAPELVSESVRNGGELLVNLSDLAWFHGSMVGDQTAACATFRALESGRYFIYAANTGPSLVVNPNGIVEVQTKASQEKLIEAKVALLKGETFFTRWFY